MTLHYPVSTSIEQTDTIFFLKKWFAVAKRYAAKALKSVSPDLETSVWVVTFDGDSDFYSRLFTKQEDFHAYLIKQLERNEDHIEALSSCADLQT
ncbi:hypothetical protein ACQU0X_26200 [Pseudovibrio ascidiaceicola]|uniref:hypothetical protein n=1 Tax=Pseudovibrio ascidiaceicola TaxID=285279 RepID=UPI003D369843